MRNYKNLIPAVFILIAAILPLSSCGKKPAESTAGYIGIDAAKEAALKDAGIPSGQAVFSTAGLDNQNGIFFYQVIFTENGVEYQYAIDALTGVVIEETHAPKINLSPFAETETASPFETAAEPDTIPMSTQTAPQPASEPVSQESALSVALAYAGVTQQEVAASKIDTKVKKGRKIFKVELITLDGVEYEYEINAADGSIISFDYDAEALFYEIPVSGAGTITEAEAKQTVLDRVPGALAENVIIHLDEDDGRLEYEGSLFYGGMEYEFKIDAYSGGVIEWEAERLE